VAKKKPTQKQTKSNLAKKRKTIAKAFNEGIVNIFSSFNNTIINLTDKAGNVLAAKSGGGLGYKGAKKATPFVAAQTAKEIIEQAKKFGIKEIEIKVKGIGAGRDSALRTFVSSDFVVKAIRDVTPVPHGGVRPKKVRRV
jgi:small subunit ribosomal protein S11